jgi:hypothetical protein
MSTHPVYRILNEHNLPSQFFAFYNVIPISSDRNTGKQHNTTKLWAGCRKEADSVGSAIGASGADPPNASSNGEGAGKKGM